MPFELTILGSNSALPTSDRYPTAQVVNLLGRFFLLDCGEGTQRQFRKAKLNPCKLTKILITHWHGDHVLGIPGLMSSMGADKPGLVLKIYGPKGTKKYLQNMFNSFAAKKIIDYEVKEIKSSIFFKNGER